MTDLCSVIIFFGVRFLVVNPLSARIKILIFFEIAMYISFNKSPDVQLSSSFSLFNQ